MITFNLPTGELVTVDDARGRRAYVTITVAFIDKAGKWCEISATGNMRGEGWHGGASRWELPRVLSSSTLRTLRAADTLARADELMRQAVQIFDASEQGRKLRTDDALEVLRHATGAVKLGREQKEAADETVQRANLAAEAHEAKAAEFAAAVATLLGDATVPAPGSAAATLAELAVDEEHAAAQCRAQAKHYADNGGGWYGARLAENEEQERKAAALVAALTMENDDAREIALSLYAGGWNESATALVETAHLLAGIDPTDALAAEAQQQARDAMDAAYERAERARDNAKPLAAAFHYAEAAQLAALAGDTVLEAEAICQASYLATAAQDTDAAANGEPVPALAVCGRCVGTAILPNGDRCRCNVPCNACQGTGYANGYGCPPCVADGTRSSGVVRDGDGDELPASGDDASQGESVILEPAADLSEDAARDAALADGRCPRCKVAPADHILGPDDAPTVCDGCADEMNEDEHAAERARLAPFRAAKLVAPIYEGRGAADFLATVADRMTTHGYRHEAAARVLDTVRSVGGDIDLPDDTSSAEWLLAATAEAVRRFDAVRTHGAEHRGQAATFALAARAFAVEAARLAAEGGEVAEYEVMTARALAE